MNVSVILPAVNETTSLRQTLRQIEQTSRADVLEYILVLCQRTSPQCRAAAAELAAAQPDRVWILEQRLPFLGGAIRDAFDAARGTHVLMMASDLETDPAAVAVMIEQAKRLPEGIVTASRWKGGPRFEGYSRLKFVLNWMFQRFFALLYGVRLTDMTYAYRIFPTPLVRSIRWEELKHPFLFETLVKPLKLGVQVIEVPSAWRARTEGQSQNTFLTNFGYFRIGFRTLLMRRRRILK